MQVTGLFPRVSLLIVLLICSLTYIPAIILLSRKAVQLLKLSGSRVNVDRLILLLIGLMIVLGLASLTVYFGGLLVQALFSH